MAMEHGSRYVYHGESEEEEISKQELEEKMWVSDDDEDNENGPEGPKSLSESTQGRRRSFLGSLLDRVRTKRKKRKSKATPPPLPKLE